MKKPTILMFIGTADGIGDVLHGINTYHLLIKHGINPTLCFYFDPRYDDDRAENEANRFCQKETLKSIPKEIEEAAVVDGCNFLQRYTKIMLPLSVPGLMTAGTFQFILCWNEFIYAMLLTSSKNIRTIQFGISYFTNEFFSDYVSMFAAIVISIIPSIAVFILFQERVITGLTAGAVKG